MAAAGDIVLIYTTWPDPETAERAGRVLVEERLAACVNRLAAMQSIYSWDGAVQCDEEWPMLIKTTKARVDEICRQIRDLHPYDVPAVAVVPVVGGDPEFLGWIAGQTAPGL